MINLPLIGVAAALVVCALIAKAFAGAPEKASKSEKAQIMKQLLALSQEENKAAAKPPSARTRAPLTVPKQKSSRRV